ncbi:DUF4229 domain-containing protein [Micromonospora sp. WMMA1923]|uniref:DUF4229 domain-containing protein n=1 Tax=Micromonospora sp. WMMA1923 TaxID=3404125 RepID=UPI003B948B1F
MSAALKYTLGRIGLFVVVLGALWLVDMSVFLRLLLALVFSAALSFFLLGSWRNEMAEEMAGAATRRRTEKERLRSALAGEDQPATEDRPGGNRPTDGDRPTAGDRPTTGDQPADERPGPSGGRD